MKIVRTAEASALSEQHIDVFSVGAHALGLYLPRPMEEKLRASESGGDRIDAKVRIALVNDTGKPQRLVFNAVYVNGVAAVREGTEVAPGQAFTVELSNVMIDAIRQQGSQSLIMIERTAAP